MPPHELRLCTVVEAEKSADLAADLPLLDRAKIDYWFVLHILSSTRL